MKPEQKLYAMVGGIILLFILYVTFYLLTQKEGLKSGSKSKSKTKSEQKTAPIAQLKAEIDENNVKLQTKLQTENNQDVMSLVESIKTHIILKNIDEIVNNNNFKTFTASDITSIEQFLNEITN